MKVKDGILGKRREWPARRGRGYKRRTRRLNIISVVKLKIEYNLCMLIKMEKKVMPSALQNKNHCRIFENSIASQ